MQKSIENSTFHFLNQLIKNNNREWFSEHKKDYENAKANVERFTEDLLQEMSGFDQQLLKVDAKKALFRIYRDVRFSKDKSPYKTNFGAALGMRRKGKESNNPGYYLHIEPGKSFIAGGLYQPDAQTLKEIRKEISSSKSDFSKIIEDQNFRHHFRGLSVEQKLQRVPNGFEKEDPMAEFLKLKQFVVKHPISDEELRDDNATQNLAKIFNYLKPLNDFLELPFH